VVDFVKRARIYYFAPILKVIGKNIPAPNFKQGFFFWATGSGYHNQTDRNGGWSHAECFLLAEGNVNASSLQSQSSQGYRLGKTQKQHIQV
jgi:hypothetical protein